MSQETIQGFRLSPQQKHLWLLQGQCRDLPLFTSCLVKIEGELDPQLLRQALDQTVAHHEILRTTFQRLPGMTIPVQVIADKAAVSLETHDLTAVSGSEQDARLDQIFVAAARREIDYRRLPLFFADLVQQTATLHRLILTASALCADGPSLQVLVRQIAGAYAACQRGEAPPANVAMQYADFAEWQNEILESDDSAGGLHYWQQFDPFPAVGQRLVFETPSPAEEFQRRTVTVEISAETAKRVREVATRESVSASSFFLACLQTLWWRSTGWSELSVGVVRDGRKFAELKDAVGLLASVMPLPGHPDKAVPFMDLLRRIAARQIEAEQWQEYFSPELIDTSARVFPLSFEFRIAPAQSLAAGLSFSLDRHDSWQSAVKLKFVCDDLGQEFSAQLEYDARAFADADVELLVQRLETLIATASREPETAVADLEILGDRERRRLLVDFNNTARVFASECEPAGEGHGCIHKLFEAQVAKNPNKVALVFEGEQLTFAELNSRANQLAHHLRGLGVGPDVPVAMALNRSVDLIVALLGILKAGGAYLPLDPGLPQARLAMMLADAGARVLVTRSDLVAELSARVDQVVSLDTDRALLAAESEDNPQAGSVDQNLVYIIFTSGSTGRPKGVAVEHRQLANYLNSIWERLNLPPGSSFATVSTVAADLGNTVLFPPLCFGGTLHLISEERATNPDALAEYCCRQPIDCLKIVPSHLSALLSAATPAHVLPRRRLVLGGEASSWSLLERIEKLAPDCEILNHYGPTEATVGAVSGHLVWKGRPSLATVPLGRPLANTQVYLLDERLRLAPIGAPGELYIGGAGVARGYINRADATAEKFIPDPFAGNGARLYRTGDQARYLANGLIEFLGRVDDQVKIHGFRIEPREIDAALREHPVIKASIVVAREDQPGEKRLVAYCVVKDQQAPAAAELRSYLRDRLPEYMLPSAFVFLKQLPLSPNGKIDRQALPAPDRFRPDGSGVLAAPRNQVEETLAGLWANVLGVERVGIHDNFFELGGDSILSIQIIARANQVGLRLTPRQLFQHQTIAELASVAGTSVAVAAQQGLVTGAVPLTPVQARFFEQNQPAPHYYNQATLLEISESLDGAILERAFAKLLIHHDALRLRFSRTENGWVQNIANPEMVATKLFQTVDLSDLSEAEQQTEFRQVVAAAQASLNLQDGLLARATLFKLGPEQSGYLLIVIHHLAIDGVSWGVLLEDLQTLCKQIGTGEQGQLPPKTTSFKNWAERLVSYAKSDVVLAESSHWLSLSEHECGRLPFDDHGENTAASARTVSVALDADETRALLQEVPAALRTQINEVLLTALARTLGSWTGSPRVLLDLEGHGREDVFEGVDLSRTVGWFTTIFPVALDLAGSKTPIDALRFVKEQLRAIPGRGLGYGLLRYASDDKTLSATLQSQQQAEVRFNYLGQLDRALPGSALFKPAAERGGAAPGFSSGQMQSPLNERGYLLNIIASVSGGALRLEWTYSTNRHAQKTVATLAATYLAELRALLAHSRRAGVESLSPSDFPSAKLSQNDLSKVLAKLRNREQ